MKRKTIIALVIISVLVIDQLLKFYIKLNIPYRDGFNILGLDWARILFIENKGMAFGLEFGGVIGKYALSVFRICMVGFLFYIINGMVKAKERKGVIICFSLIIAGAIGNIIDSMFYGMIFSESHHTGQMAELFPEGGGYAGFLQGRVVDMFYFPMIDTILPDWVPIWGGKPFLFFRPVFNVADSAISVGVAMILLFYTDLFKDKKKESTEENEDPSVLSDTILEEG